MLFCCVEFLCYSKNLYNKICTPANKRDKMYLISLSIMTQAILKGDNVNALMYKGGRGWELKHFSFGIIFKNGFEVINMTLQDGSSFSSLEKHLLYTQIFPGTCIMFATHSLNKDG